jgi:hypothetical protein
MNIDSMHPLTGDKSMNRLLAWRLIQAESVFFKPGRPLAPSGHHSGGNSKHKMVRNNWRVSMGRPCTIAMGLMELRVTGPQSKLDAEDEVPPPRRSPVSAPAPFPWPPSPNPWPPLPPPIQALVLLLLLLLVVAPSVVELRRRPPPLLLSEPAQCICPLPITLLTTLDEEDEDEVAAAPAATEEEEGLALVRLVRLAAAFTSSWENAVK